MEGGSWGGREEARRDVFGGGEQLYCTVRERQMRDEKGGPSCRLQQAPVWYILHASDIATVNTGSPLLKQNKPLKSPGDDCRNYTLVRSSRGQMMNKHVAVGGEELLCIECDQCGPSSDT